MDKTNPICILRITGITKYISIKKGTGNSVHQEKINMFFSFIFDLLGENHLNYLKKFHYGDDTLNDTGVQRYSAAQCKTRYENEIKLLNTELNKKENLLIFLDRFVFQGNVESLMTDVIYHGNIESGLWASRDEIIKYVCNNSFPSSTVHFGPLTYQVWGRDEKRTAVHPDRRYVMQVKWGSITKDLEKIRKENDNV